jgi:hypothetical protein
MATLDQQELELILSLLVLRVRKRVLNTFTAIRMMMVKHKQALLLHNVNLVIPKIQTIS